VRYGPSLKYHNTPLAVKKLLTRKWGVGRPRLRWLDYVEADIKALGVKRWRIKAQDSKEWSAILREAKSKLKGP
jgi:hypothetical protein